MKQSLTRLYQLAAGQHQRLLGRRVLIPAEHAPRALVVISGDPAAKVGHYVLDLGLVNDDPEVLGLLPRDQLFQFDLIRFGLVLGPWREGMLTPDFFDLDEVRRLTAAMSFAQKRIEEQYQIDQEREEAYRAAEHPVPDLVRIATLEAEVAKLKAARTDPERN